MLNVEPNMIGQDKYQIATACTYETNEIAYC